MPYNIRNRYPPSSLSGFGLGATPVRPLRVRMVEPAVAPARAPEADATAAAPKSDATAAARPVEVVSAPSAPAAPVSAPAPAPAAPPVTDEYEVQPGDSLWDIAERTYGDPLRWTELFETNRDVIGSDGGLIRAGQKLRLPKEGR